MRTTLAILVRFAAAGLFLLGIAPPAAAQALNESCVVSVLNRNVRVNPDGTWVLPNVPANFGFVRARVTCIINGQTVSGESAPFLIPPNGAVDVPPIHFGSTTAIPTQILISAPTTTITALGATLQLAVTASYVSGPAKDVTAASTGTQYAISNSQIAAISPDGLVTAVMAGTVLVQATHEGRSGMISLRVAPGGADSDGDGIPDADELAMGLNPQNAVDGQEDFDRDGLTNVQEYQLGTDIRLADADADGLKDGDEVARGTNPLLWDTDGDGIADGLEVQSGSNPLNATSYDLAAALNGITVQPTQFVLTFNTILGEVTRQLTVTGALKDGRSINLTSKSRGTNYASSDLNICNFGSTDGLIYAGQQGNCAITVTAGGFTVQVPGEVHRFAPTPLAFVDLGGPGHSVDVGGSYAYVATGAAGLQIVDVTTHSAPQIVATLNLPGSPVDVKVAGTRAFVAAGSGGLHIVDVSNPLLPARLGTFAISDARDVRVYGNLAYVAAGAGGLSIVDVSVPAAPRGVGSIGNIGTAQGVDVAGNYAVVANGAGLRIIDISNPASPVSVGSIALPGDAQDLVARGTFAYVADYTGSLQVVSFAAPNAPSVVGTTPTVTGGMLADVALNGNFTFGADIFFVNGVPIVDVTTPTLPTPRAILDFSSFRDDDGAGIAVDGSYVYLGTNQGRLYIGQYRLLEDLEGIAPTVTISSPPNNSTFIEGETIPVQVDATDDVAVVSAQLIVDGVAGELDTSAPYQFTVTAPAGVSSMVIGASAVDLGSNVGQAPNVQVFITPDPLTTVTGVVTDAFGTALGGAVVTCVGETGTSLSDGSFSVAGVKTIQPTIGCTADYAGTVPLHGVSSRLAPVRGGTTAVGTFPLLAVPVIASITPAVIDSYRAPTFLRVTGANLTGTSFSFVADSQTIVTAGTPTVDATGTSATVPISVVLGSQGARILTATNSVGTSDTFATSGNTLTIVNLPPSGDADSDGLANDYEIAYGTNASAADSDRDGLPDGWEVRFGLDPLVADASQDADGDNLTNAQEFAAGSNPRNADVVPPAVVQTLPADGDTNYPLNGVYVARFSEPLRAALTATDARAALQAALPVQAAPVDLQAAGQTLAAYMATHGEGNTVVPGTIQMSRAGTPVAGSLSLSNDGLSVTFSPAAALIASTLYTVTVQGLQDVAGTPMASAVQTSFTTGTVVDNAPPAITGINPVNGSSGVPINAPLTLQFSKPMDPATLTAANLPIYDNTLGQIVAGMVQTEPSGLFASFVPTAPWSIGRTFSIYPSQAIRDTSGNQLGYYSFYFSTGFAPDTAAPAVVGMSPPNGVTGVPLNAPVMVQFSEPLDPISAAAGLQVLDGAVSMPGSLALSDGNRRLTFTPSAQWTPSRTYSVSIATAIRDVAGNALVPIAVGQFTTGLQADTQAPSVVRGAPVNGSGDVPTNARLQFVFNERMNPLWASSSTVFAYPSQTGVPIAASIQTSADGLTITITPAAPLRPSTHYTYYAYGVTDLVGNYTYVAYSFTTAAGAQTSGPGVTSLSPSNGSTGIPLNARVVAQMSSAVDPSSVAAGAITVAAGGVAVAGTVSLSGDRSLIFTPAAALAASTTFTVSVASVLDLAGNPGQPAAAAFTTGGVAATSFTVTSYTPPYGTQGVAVTSPITMTFSGPIDPSTVTPATATAWTGAGTIALTYQVNGNVLTMQPVTPLPGGASVNVQVYNVQDVVGNYSGYLYTYFVTAAVLDTTPPAVIGVSPADGSTGVGLNASVAVTFSESLNPGTVNNNTLALFANGSRFGYVSGISSDNRTVYLNGGNMPPSSTVMVVATSDIQDLSGNRLAEFSSTFSTLSGFDTSIGQVVGTRPGNGASGVDPANPIVLFVNKRIDPATVSGAVVVSQDGVSVNGTIQLLGNGRSVVFTPQSPLGANAYVQVYFTGSARDTAGNVLYSTQFSFRTAVDPATAVPVPTAVSPNYGASNVPGNAAIGIAFNVPLDPATVNTSTINMQGPNGIENITVSVDQTGRVVRIQPSAQLAANSYYYFWTNPGITSATGVVQQNMGWWYFYTGAAADTTAPVVSSITPPNGAVNVGDNAGVIVRFNEPIDPLSVNASTTSLVGSLGPIAYSASFGNSNRDLSLTPTVPLPDGSVVSLTLLGVTDQASNAVSPTSSQFAVASGADLEAPVATATNPVNGQGNVPSTTTIAVRFNEPIDPSTVGASSMPIYDNVIGQQVSGSYTVSTDGQTITFVPAAPLAVNRSHSVYFQWSGITDLAGNPAGAGGGLGNFSFTTGFSLPATDPVVLGVSPADGLIDVPRNTQIVIDFNRAIDVLTSSLITLSANGQPVQVYTGYSNGDARVTLTPLLPLAASTLHTLSVGAVKDLTGRSLTPVTTQFTTAPGTDLIAPQVTLISPANGSGNVPTNAVVQVAFSERIDPLTMHGGTFQIWPQQTGIPLNATYMVASDQRSATLVPSAPLLASTPYYIQVNGVVDFTGQSLYFASSFTTGSGPSTIGPGLVALTPSDGSTGVPLNARVVATFAAELNPLSVTAGSISVTAGNAPVAGVVLLQSDRRTLTFTPAANLAATMQHDVEISGPVDLAGRAVQPVSASFTSGTSTVGSGTFSVTSVTPAYGAANVSVNSTIQVTFSNTVNAGSVATSTMTLWDSSAGNIAVTYAVTGNVVTLTPVQPLPGNRQINLQVYGVQDVIGNNVNYLYTYFNTEAVLDTTPPTVQAVTPADGTTGVPVTAPIAITFSESVNPNTVNNNTVALFANGARFGSYSGISSDNRTIYMNPGVMPGLSTVTVSLTSGIQDLSGNLLVDHTSSFVTAAGFDTSRPSVLGMRPGNGASGVDPASPLSLFVSKPLNTSTVAGAIQISQNGVPLLGTVQVGSGGQNVVFTPASPWAPNAFIQVFFDQSAQDLVGNALNYFSASFRVAPDPATTQPVPVATVPTYGESGQPLNVRPGIAFNVPLDPASVDTSTVSLYGPNGLESTTISLDATGRVIRIVPAGTLVANSYYYFQTMPGIRSVTGVSQQNMGWWYFYTGAATDSTAPTVRSINPPHAAINVGDNAGIIVRFSDTIDTLSVSAATVSVTGPLGPLTTSFGFGNSNRNVYVTPLAALPDGQVVTVSVNGVTDAAGNAVSLTSAQFVVGSGPDVAAPAVIASNPVSGLSNVPPGVIVSIRLNEPIDPGTVSSSTMPIYDNFVGQQVAGTYSVSSDSQTISFVPASPLAVNRSHSVYFQWYGITDLAGNPLGPGGGLGNFSFTTGTTTPAGGPQVVAVSPADGLTSVPRNTLIRIDFDRAIDTLSSGDIVLSAGGQTVPVYVGYGNGDARVQLTPAQPLQGGTLYTITIGAVRDLAGQAMATPVVRRFTTATGVDLVAPTVTFVSPANGAGAVPTNTLIQVGFSERVDPLTVHSGSFQLWPQQTGIPVAASYMVSSDGRTATLVPAAPLSPLTSYAFQVNGITDLVGQSVYSYSGFTTGAGAQTAPPIVQNVSPPDGTTDVPVNAKVSVLISAPVSPASVNTDALTVSASGVRVAGAMSLSTDRLTVTFTPSSNLAPGTTFAVAASGLTDQAGNTLIPFSSSFTTGTGTATTGPLTVMSANPANQSIDVAVNANIVITFNRAINPLSVNTTTFQVYYTGVNNAPGTYAVNGSSVSFTPASALPGSTTIGVVINGIRDLADLSNNYYSQSFVTANAADTVAPSVVSVTPADGATGVGLNSTVVVTFSESLNPATINNSTFALFANGTRFGYISAVSADSRTVTLNGGTLPGSSTVTLVVSSSVTDLASNPLADFTSAFTTAPAADTSRPSVVGQRPGNGANGVSALLPIVLFVNEPLDASSVQGALQITQDGLLVTGTTQLLGGGQVVRFDPSVPWNFNALVQVFLDSNARDLNGNSLYGYSGSFRTSADPAATMPTVTATNPVYGTSNAPLNPVISLGYNVALNPATVNGATVSLSGPNGLVPATVALDPTGLVIRITPASVLLASSFYSFQTTTGIQSATGVAQQYNSSWYFVTGSASDTTGPNIRAITPPNGATAVGDNASIIVRFDEPVNPLSVNSSTIAVSSALSAVQTSIGFANGNRDVYLTPNITLPDGEVVTISVAGVTDPSGNPVAAQATQFLVSNGPDLYGPYVDATNPVNGLTGVPTNVVVSLHVSEPVDPGSVHSGTFQVYDNVVGQPVPGTYTVSGDARTISFVPAAPLAVNRSHSVYFQWMGMTDLAGNLIGPSGGLGNFTFTTGSTTDTSGPQVIAVSPADLLTGVPRNPQVMIEFDRPIDVLSAGLITLSVGGQAVNVGRTFSSGDARVVLTPLSPLNGSTVHTVTVGLVNDLAGNTAASTTTTAFTTGSGVDLLAPSVTAVTPPNGATGVAVSAAVQVTFSERMNPLTVNASTFYLIVANTGARVAADVVVAVNGGSAALVPIVPLDSDTQYYVQLTAVADLTGQQTGVFTGFRTAP